MLTGRLLVTLVVNLGTAIIALAVARRLARREATGEAGRALRLFALWWAAFAADTVLNALTWLAGGLGLANEPVTAVLTYLALVSIVLMIWGLMYYLAYLFTGRDDLYRPIAAFYALSFLGALALVVSLRPIGVHMGPWAGEVAYLREPPAAAALWFALFFLLPPLGGAIAYGALLFRVKGRPERYRILAVSLGIFLWFTTALVITGTQPGADAAAILGKVVGVGCMLFVLSAYVQPAWLAERLGGSGVVHAPRLPVGDRSERAMARARRREALTERVRELV
jgi:hypothetical protein